MIGYTVVGYTVIGYTASTWLIKPTNLNSAPNYTKYLESRSTSLRLVLKCRVQQYLSSYSV